MPQNNGRKVLFVLALLIGAALLILLPDRPFRLGLDLEGGTRIVYSVDFDKAFEEGKISADQLANKPALMAETIGLVRERIDPDGVLEPRIYPEGEERFVVEIPGIANLAEVQADLPLAAEVRDFDRSMRVQLVQEGDDKQLLNFPSGGGVIRIGKNSCATNVASVRSSSTCAAASAARRQRTTWSVRPSTSSATTRSRAASKTPAR